MIPVQAAFIITGSEIITGRRQDALVRPFASMLYAKGISVGQDPYDLGCTR